MGQVFSLETYTGMVIIRANTIDSSIFQVTNKT